MFELQVHKSCTESRANRLSLCMIVGLAPRVAEADCVDKTPRNLWKNTKQLICKKIRTLINKFKLDNSSNKDNEKIEYFRL